MTESKRRRLARLRRQARPLPKDRRLKREALGALELSLLGSNTLLDSLSGLFEMSDAEMADLLGITSRQISHCRTGHRRLSKGQRLAIALLLVMHEPSLLRR